MQPADYFKQIPLFADLGPEEIVDVLRIARVVTFAPGALLCTRGELGQCAYVIERGDATVRAADEAGNPVVIARVGPGEVVGELSLVDGHPRSADVVALSEVRGYRIDRGELDALRRAMHPAAFKILRRIAITVSDRLRDVNDAVAAELTGKGSAGRAARNTAERPGTPPAKRSLAPATKAHAASDEGRASRAGVRASRELQRTSLPGPVAAPSARASRPSAAGKAPAAATAAPTSLWRSMLDRLSGAPWK